jgi:hypothetical protein
VIIIFFRRLINKFKQEIYHDDLKRVLSNASISALLISILAGGLNFIFYNSLNYSLVIITLMIGFFVADRVKNSYYNYHILYSLFSMLFTFLGLIIAEYVMIGLNFGFNGTFLYSIKYFFAQFNIFKKSFYEFWNIINIVVYILSIFISYKKSITY